MNIKERGITVGDLLIILIVRLSTSILIKSFNKDKKTALDQSIQEKISYNQNSLSKFNSNLLST